jgi:pyruvate kinase
MAAVRNQASDKRKRSAVAQRFQAVGGRPMNTARTPKQIKSKQAENKRQRKTAYAVRKKRRQRIAVVEELTAYAVDVASNNAAKKVRLFKAITAAWSAARHRVRVPTAVKIQPLKTTTIMESFFELIQMLIGAAVVAYVYYRIYKYESNLE